jgi:glyoxylase-like metal-dependent hydrolase (beta-lactamase superfamily II)
MTVTVHIIQAGMGCAHLIEGDAGLVLVDAGSPGNEHRILRQMRAVGRRAVGRDDLRLILITHAHFDHDGSAAALRRLTGAPIAIHRDDAGALARGETRLGAARGRGIAGQVVLELLGMHLCAEPSPADILLEEGDHLARYGLDAVVLHTPGHTSGSCCLLVERRLVFVGDLLSNNGRPSIQRYYAQDWSIIGDSVDRVQAARPEWVYTGHGRRPMSGETLQRL